MLFRSVVESNDVATIRVGEADGTQGGMCWGDSYNTYTSTHPMRFYTGGTAGSHIYNGMGGSLSLYLTGGSARSPIFYDSDDTGYYIDPNSTASNALRMRGGALFGPNPTWGAYLYVGTNGNLDVGTATVAATDGNLHLDAANGYVMYLNNYATSSYTIACQSIRSPIFYDYNDTSYYVDPSNYSNIVDGNIQLYTSITIHMSNTSTYSTSNYYPVVMGVP